MKNFFTRTRIKKLFGLLFFIGLNLAFYGLDAPGAGTGFEAACGINPIFGIFMSLIIGIPTLGYIYFLIMDN